MMTVMYNALEFDNGGGRARRPSAPRRRLSNRSRSAKSAPAKVAGDDVLDAAVRAALAGDEEGFRTLYRALQPGLLRYLRTVVGDEAERPSGDPGEVADAELVRGGERRCERQPRRIAERAGPRRCGWERDGVVEAAAQ